MKQLIIASTSTLHGQTYLEYLLPTLKKFFSKANEVIFIPYARPGGISHDTYTEIAQQAFASIGIKINGLHSFNNPAEALQKAKGIFTGGGNTFVLVKQLHEQKLMSVLQNSINEGVPYLGTSAGSNICGINMKTTNDMPIVYPSSFNTLGVVPFNINPHYLDPNPNSSHMGETREQRLKEFHSQNNIPVIGLREGSWLEVNEPDIQLKGALSARIFKANQKPYELATESSLNDIS